MARALPITHRQAQALTAADLSELFGMTPRQWTRLASEGKVPGAWQPAGSKGKWLFDRATVERWHRSTTRKVIAWQGYTSEDRRIGAVPSVTGANTDSPSAPKIAALLKSVCASG